MLSLLSDLAEGGPVLGLVDDLQWVDGESAHALRFVARRIDAEGIALVFATTEVPELDASTELTVVGLDRVASDALLIERSGMTPAPEVRAFLWEQTHGNPSALIEMGGSLTPAQLEGAEPLPDDVRVGLALQHRLTERAARLPDDTRRLLLVAAAEGTGDTALVLGAAASLGVRPEALEPAELAGLVSVDGRGLLAFHHPLMRSAIYQGAPFGRRQAVHLAIADALGDRETDRRTWHRSAATVGPDDAVADELEASAEQALARGGHAAASSALERAADLSTDRGMAGRRLASAAEEAWLAGQGSRAAALGDRAVALVGDASKAELDVVRAQVEAGAGDRRAAFERMLAAAGSIGEADPAKAAGVLVDAGRIAWMEADPVMMIEVGRSMDALDLRDDAPEAFGVGVMQGLHRLLEGDPDGAAKMIGDWSAASIRKTRDSCTWRASPPCSCATTERHANC